MELLLVGCWTAIRPDVTLAGVDRASKHQVPAVSTRPSQEAFTTGHPVWCIDRILTPCACWFQGPPAHVSPCLARGFTTLDGTHGGSKYIFVDGVRMWDTPRFPRFVLGLGTYWLPVKDVYSFVLDVGYGGLKTVTPSEWRVPCYYTKGMKIQNEKS